MTRSFCTRTIKELDTTATQCRAIFDWETGELSGEGCNEPCRFCMQKSGEGNPPIPTQEWLEGFRAGIKHAK